MTEISNCIDVDLSVYLSMYTHTKREKKEKKKA